MRRQVVLELVVLHVFKFQPQGLMDHLQAPLEEQCVQPALAPQLIFEHFKTFDELNYLIVDEFSLQTYGR